MGAIQFIENLDRTSLTISDEEFEVNVEAAVSAIAEKHEVTTPISPVQLSEMPALVRPEIIQQRSNDASSSARRPTPSNDSESGEQDEKVAMSGLLRTIQRPLSSI